jgi:phosphoglycerate-specific signal transduction histidine kinase
MAVKLQQGSAIQVNGLTSSTLSFLRVLGKLNAFPTIWRSFPIRVMGKGKIAV